MIDERLAWLVRTVVMLALTVATWFEYIELKIGLTVIMIMILVAFASKFHEKMMEVQQ